MNDTSNTNNQEINKYIMDLTTETWVNSGKALLLARAGQMLAHSGYDLKSYLKGQKLIDIIRRDIAVTVLVSPLDPLIHGLVPKDVTLQADQSVYFSKQEATPHTVTKGIAHSSHIATKIQQGKTNSLWTHLINELEPSDLKRISIPLDIIVKLQNKWIK